MFRYELLFRNSSLIYLYFPISQKDENHQNPTTAESLPSNKAISLKNVVGIWKTSTADSEKSGQFTLDNMNIDFPKGKLIGIIGPVGAGKSSLLQLLLHELPLQSGTINISGTTSYASQEPWVFAASVRQNILFGENYDSDRYNKVVKCCALQSDFEQFENGDRTIIGEKGTLSGGQKARIK